MAIVHDPSRSLPVSSNPHDYVNAGQTVSFIGVPWPCEIDGTTLKPSYPYPGNNYRDTYCSLVDSDTSGLDVSYRSMSN